MASTIRLIEDSAFDTFWTLLGSRHGTVTVHMSRFGCVFCLVQETFYPPGTVIQTEPGIL